MAVGKYRYCPLPLQGAVSRFKCRTLHVHSVVRKRGLLDGHVKLRSDLLGMIAMGVESEMREE